MTCFAANDLNLMQTAFDKAIATLAATGPIDEDVRDTVALAIVSMAKAGQLDVYRLQLFAMLEGSTLQRAHGAHCLS